MGERATRGNEEENQFSIYQRDQVTEQWEGFALISLTPSFSQVVTTQHLIQKPFQRFTRETVETVRVTASRFDHRT
jgi:hypothetical protein